ncbi:MAG: hypothetical protein EBU84_03315 [Actinobacteria bacterium]|nr:hypothetical protein [Actinomycetota bacterium]
MATDLTGGLSLDREFLFAEQPDNPEMRESVNCWMWNSTADFGMPRIGIEAVGDNWESHDIQINIAFADGRVLNAFEPGKKHNPIGSDGQPRILGAGPMRFELVEPYRHWKLVIDGMAIVNNVGQLVRGEESAGQAVQRVPLRLEVDLRHSVPPWEVGTLREEARVVLETQDEGALMGGPRFEQLFRATGFMNVDGSEYQIDGGGLRVRRTGIRRLGTFRGHCWQSAVFPSGRAFGLNTYPPRTDGKPTLNEGYLFDGDGALIPAKVVNAPWLRHKQPWGEDVSVVIETARGETMIRGESVLSAFHPMPIGAGNGFVLQQAIVRYTLDGESAHGMMERSTDVDLMEQQ